MALQLSRLELLILHFLHLIDSTISSKFFDLVDIIPLKILQMCKYYLLNLH